MRDTAYWCSYLSPNPNTPEAMMRGASGVLEPFGRKDHPQNDTSGLQANDSPQDEKTCHEITQRPIKGTFRLDAPADLHTELQAGNLSHEISASTGSEPRFTGDHKYESVGSWILRKGLDDYHCPAAHVLMFNTRPDSATAQQSATVQSLASSPSLIAVACPAELESQAPRCPPPPYIESCTNQLRCQPTNETFSQGWRPFTGDRSPASNFVDAQSQRNGSCQLRDVFPV